MSDEEPLAIASATFLQTAEQKQSSHPVREYTLRIVAGKKSWGPSFLPPQPPNNLWPHAFVGHRDDFVNVARMILSELDPPPDRTLNTLERIEGLLEKLLEKQSGS